MPHQYYGDLKRDKIGDRRILLGRSQGIPEKKARVWVVPKIVNNREMRIEIIGDPEGLAVLGQALTRLARADQPAENIPPGERRHFHLENSGLLAAPSAYTLLMRADASETGELPSSLVGWG